MYFYCYNIECTNTNNISLYGRIVNDQKNMKNCGSKISKLNVHAISPIMAVFNNNIDISYLKNDILKHFKLVKKFEILKFKNIFYDDLEKNINVIRFSTKNFQGLNNFESQYCCKIFFEFSNALENVIISKKIKCPCLLEISKNSIDISIDDIVNVIKCDMPKLNFASFICNFVNRDILSYTICINGDNFFAGKVVSKYSIDLQAINDDKIKKFETSSLLVQGLLDVLEQNEVDCVIYHNLHGELLKKLTRFIKCDMFVFASGNLKCRDFSIEDLCNYFKIDYKENYDQYKLTKILLDLFYLSDALLLGKELSEISGFTINKVLNNNRAEIIEYALMHELYDKNYILPPVLKNQEYNYTGGLVLEPFKDCYNSLVLLLDFNSLYPSIIQEFNVCFSNKTFEMTEKGFLPKILANLVQRRKAVKKLISENKDNKIYNIRQQALKILANSIYGCLGYPKSRFCNYKMASFITQKGRDILNDTKFTIESNLNMCVIYGDTDSIMIDSKLEFNNENLIVAKGMADKVKELINCKYKYIEIDLEKIFCKLFLYAKKRYAGIYQDKKGEFQEEFKGIDTVRRNFCKAASDILNRIYKVLLKVDNVSFVEEKNQIFQILTEEYNKFEERDKKDFLINNILSKSIDKFAENVPLPHVHLCKRLAKQGIFFNVGDMISYCIGKNRNEISFHKRGFLINEDFEIDYDYYITQQILPSLNRIFAVTKYANNETIFKIFNKPVVKQQSFKSLKFLTECCENLQFPAKFCQKCNSETNEDFYFRKVQTMIRKEVTNLYQTEYRCKDCNVVYFGVTLNCTLCNNQLDFVADNFEFDNFLENMLKNFEYLQFTKIINYVKMHINKSKFRVFDISIYFKQSI